MVSGTIRRGGSGGGVENEVPSNNGAAQQAKPD